ncbi:DUF1963 domain-containing protein [Nocardia rhamnosiphila]
MLIPPADLLNAARSHLDPRLAEHWISLLRPAIRLRHADDGDPVVGYLGGLPLLPPGEPWPGRQGGGLDDENDEDDEYPSLQSLLLTLDLAALPRIELDLPESGRLLFFRDEEEFETFSVRYYSADTVLVQHQTPEEIGDYTMPRVDLTATVEWTAPEAEHRYQRYSPAVKWTPASKDFSYERFGPTKVRYTEAFHDAIRNLMPDGFEIPTHLIGGYGRGVQYNADFAPCSTPVIVPGPQGPVADTALPIMLAQIDTDDRVNMGDAGNSHWLIDRDDLTALRFDKVDMVWSCH